MLTPAAGLLAQPHESPSSPGDTMFGRRRSPRPAPAWQQGDPKPKWGRLAAGTAAVLALVCLGVFVLKWLNGGMPLNRGRYLELLESRPIGSKVQLFLIKVGQQAVLIACRGETVARVAQFHEDDLPEPHPAPQVHAALKGRFKAMLHRISRGKK